MERLNVLKEISKREKKADYLIWAVFALLVSIIISNLILGAYLNKSWRILLNIIYAAIIALIFWEFWRIYYKRFR